MSVLAWLLAALGVLFWPAGPAAAQVARVQTGDHADFARLVVLLPPQAATAGGWRLVREGGDYVLDPGLPGLRYDLADAFRRITRERVADLEADRQTGQLRLIPGCDCHVQAFELRPGIVVVDLREGPPPPGSPFERDAAGIPQPPVRISLPTRPRSRPASAAPGSAGGAEAAAGAAPLPAELAAGLRAAALDAARARRPGADPAAADLPAPQQAPATTATTASPAPPATAAPVPPAAPAAPATEATEATEAEPDDGAVPSAGTVADLRQALLEGLGRGAARGVVDLALPETSAVPPAPDHSGQDPAGHLPNLRIAGDTSGRGAAAGPDEAAGPAGLMEDGRVCPSESAFDIASWGDPLPVAVALGPRLAGLMGEFDRPDRQAVDRAARYLLHLGFGIEARQVLDLAAPPLAEDGLLRALSGLVDGEPPPPGSDDLAGMEVCDGPAALWAALADAVSQADGGGGRDGTAGRNPAVLRWFSGLPPHLRRHLGPILADHLLAAGEARAARTVLDAILRAPGPPDAATELIRHRLAAPDPHAGAVPPAAAGGEGHAEDGHAGMTGAPADRSATPAPAAAAAPGEALRPLDDLSRESGLPGLAAMAMSLRQATAAGRVADAATLAGSEAMLAQFAGTVEVAALGVALAEAQALAGDFGRAFDLAAEFPGARPAVWAQLAARGGTAVLLDRALVPPPGPALPAPTERALAARLVAAGFPREALAWLDPARRADGGGAEDALAAAEAHLADRDGRSALRRLAGQEGARADDLRGRAERLLASPVAPGDAGPSGLAAPDGQGDLSRAGPGAASGDPAAAAGAAEAGAASAGPPGPAPSAAAVSPAAAQDLVARALRNRQWEVLAEIAPEPWRQAAMLVAPPPGSAAGAGGTAAAAAAGTAPIAGADAEAGGPAAPAPSASPAAQPASGTAVSAAGQEAAGSDAAGPDAAGPDAAGSGTAGSGTAGPDAAGSGAIRGGAAPGTESPPASLAAARALVEDSSAARAALAAVLAATRLPDAPPPP